MSACVPVPGGAVAPVGTVGPCVPVTGGTTVGVYTPGSTGRAGMASTGTVCTPGSPGLGTLTTPGSPSLAGMASLLSAESQWAWDGRHLTSGHCHLLDISHTHTLTLTYATRPGMDPQGVRPPPETTLLQAATEVETILAAHATLCEELQQLCAITSCKDWAVVKGVDDNRSDWPRIRGVDDNSGNDWPRIRGVDDNSSNNWPRIRGVEENTNTKWPLVRGKSLEEKFTNSKWRPLRGVPSEECSPSPDLQPLCDAGSPNEWLAERHLALGEATPNQEWQGIHLGDWSPQAEPWQADSNPARRVEYDTSLDDTMDSSQMSLSDILEGNGDDILQGNGNDTLDLSDILEGNGNDILESNGNDILENMEEENCEETFRVPSPPPVADLPTLVDTYSTSMTFSSLEAPPVPLLNTHFSPISESNQAPPDPLLHTDPLPDTHFSPILESNQAPSDALLDTHFSPFTELMVEIPHFDPEEGCHVASRTDSQLDQPSVSTPRHHDTPVSNIPSSSVMNCSLSPEITPHSPPPRLSPYTPSSLPYNATPPLSTPYIAIPPLSTPYCPSPPLLPSPTSPVTTPYASEPHIPTPYTPTVAPCSPHPLPSGVTMVTPCSPHPLPSGVTMVTPCSPHPLPPDVAERPQSFGLHSPDKLPKSQTEFQQIASSYGLQSPERASAEREREERETREMIQASYNPRMFCDGGLYLDPDIIGKNNTSHLS